MRARLAIFTALALTLGMGLFGSNAKAEGWYRGGYGHVVVRPYRPLYGPGFYGPTVGVYGPAVYGPVFHGGYGWHGAPRGWAYGRSGRRGGRW